MWPLYVGSNGQIRKSIPFSVKVAYCSCNRSSVVGLYQLGRSAGGGGCRRGACGVGWVGFDWFGGSGG